MNTKIIYTLFRGDYKYTCYEWFNPKETVPCQALKRKIVKVKWR